MNLFKLRYTYGLVGNDAISAPSDRFFYLSDVNLNNGGTGYTWGINANNYYNGYFINRYGNPEVTWEVAKKANYGIELGLFNSIMIQADYFVEDRSKIYMQRQYIPESMGLTTSISSNIGKVKSSGFDISLDYNQLLIMAGTYQLEEISPMLKMKLKLMVNQNIKMKTLVE